MRIKLESKDDVHVRALVAHDAIATCNRDGYSVKLELKIPGCTKDHRALVSFRYPGTDPEHLDGLLVKLKKDRPVELMVTTKQGDDLDAKYIRIDRIDYEISEDEQKAGKGESEEQTGG